MDEFISQLEALIGAKYVLTSNEDKAPYLTDWRGRYAGQALAVVKPANTQEVSAIVKLCGLYNINIVPQGGNTGMCGGATPMNETPNLVVLLERLNRIRGISTLGNSISVDAGCILLNIAREAEKHQRLFPLSLGAEGSCQIGGNLSTNAGGTAVLKYGTMRELCLGLEVVLPNGEILDLMTALRKDSTGTDLKQIFIGAEGTLGIITGAVLKLFPAIHSRQVAFVQVENIENVLKLLETLRSHIGENLQAFELMNQEQLAVIQENLPLIAMPFENNMPFQMLIEVVNHAPLERALEMALEQKLILDALIAQNETQAQSFWKIRHSVSEGSKKAGYVISHDSVVPLENQAQFVHMISSGLAEQFPFARLAIHGHVGDGNLHILAIIPQNITQNKTTLTSEINQLVDEITYHLKGSISAEHGVGYAHVKRFEHVTSPQELALHKSLKATLDPQNVMNRGKIFL